MRGYKDITDAVVWADQSERQFSPAVEQNIIHGFSMVQGREMTRLDMHHLTLAEARSYITAAHQAEVAENKRSHLPKLLSFTTAAVLVAVVGGGLLFARPNSNDGQRNASSLTPTSQDAAIGTTSDTSKTEQTATVQPVVTPPTPPVTTTPTTAAPTTRRTAPATVTPTPVPAPAPMVVTTPTPTPAPTPSPAVEPPVTAPVTAPVTEPPVEPTEPPAEEPVVAPIEP